MSQPSLFKRFLAALYDSFLVLATLFIATALTLPFTKGEVAADKHIYMSLYLLLVIYIFYAWFWMHGGQTLGMRVWKQKLITTDGQALNWTQSFIRFVTGLPAWLLLVIGVILWIKPDIATSLTPLPGWSLTLAGVIWLVLDTRKDNWRDKLSGTQIIVVEANRK